MSEGRDENGRFLPGHSVVSKLGGRPPAAVEEAYFKSFCKAVSLEKWVKATEKLLEKALTGNIQAYKVLAQYAMRLPTQRIEGTVVTAEVAMTLDEWKETVAQRRREVEMLEE